MTHLILGSGNLALALELAMRKRGIWSVVAPFESADSWNLDVEFPDLRPFDVIWHCTGGRAREAHNAGARSWKHNVDIPRRMMDAAESARLVFFSTLDCAHPEYPTRPHMRCPEPRSEWIRQKLALESSVITLNRPNTAFVRLGSLYGEHRPLQTFPGRLLGHKWPDEAALSLPMNEVVPTPADWAAEKLIEAMDRNLWNPSTYTCHHLAPLGSIASMDWAKLIFGPRRDARGYLEKVTWDETRPRVTQGGSSLDVADEHWSILWQRHFKPEAYQPV